MKQAGLDSPVQRRSRVIRTAWVLAAIAALVFIGFILSGVLNS